MSKLHPLPYRQSVLLVRGAILLSACAQLSVAGAESLIDPMRPPGPVVAVGHSPRVPARPLVTAVFVSGDRRVAIFAGHVVQAGDRVGDVVIQKVLDDGVQFLRAGRAEVARLPQVAADVRAQSQESKP